MENLEYIKNEIKNLDNEISKKQEELNRLSSIRSVLEAYVDSYTVSNEDDYDFDDLPF